MLRRRLGLGPWLVALLLLGGFVFVASCSRPETPRQAQMPAVAPAGSDETLLAERRQKDASFKSNPGSPIPPQERSRFQGLSYYPPNSALRFLVKLVRYPRPESLRLGTNTGEIRDALRYGYFEFEVDGRSCRLQVYRMMEDLNSGGTQLFIPFRDATSGKQTYAGGRYIDLRENTSGQYELDFNEAYNPYCAYTKTYSCPIPPAENTLPVPIEAGEKSAK